MKTKISFRRWKHKLQREIGAKAPITGFYCFQMFNRPDLSWAWAAVDRNGQVYSKGHILNEGSEWENVSNKVIRDSKDQPVIGWMASFRHGGYYRGDLRSMWKEEMSY